MKMYASLGGTAMAAGVSDRHHSGFWIRSSRCGPGKNCVEFRRRGAAVLVRDSKSRAVLPALDRTQWIAFVAHCRTK